MQLIISGRGIVLTRTFKDAVTAQGGQARPPLLPALIEARATFSGREVPPHRRAHAARARRRVLLERGHRRRPHRPPSTRRWRGLDHQVRRAKDPPTPGAAPAHARGADAPGRPARWPEPDGRPDHASSSSPG